VPGHSHGTACRSPRLEAARQGVQLLSLSLPAEISILQFT
jgi:hypothetical protein